MPFSAARRWMQLHAPTLAGGVVVLTMSIGLAWQSADWLRFLRAPVQDSTPSSAQQPVKPPSHTLAHLFGANTSASAPAVRPTNLRLTLLGSFVHADPARSSAIIRNEGNQPQRYSIDSEISRGVRLNAVHADHIELLRNGQREILAFPRSRSEQLAETPAQPATATPSQLDELQNDDLTLLRERMDALHQQMETSGAEPSDAEPSDQTTESN